ncbi:MAG: metal-sulfur cluster assembly factor [Anaerolineae bacterium]|nr:metal-sulfur cluster assembly factor [Anaerolineae bacterium]
MPEQPDAKEAKVYEALRRVVDPEIGLNVVELGLIRDVQIWEDGANIVMILTTPFCPYGPQLMYQVQLTVQEELDLPTTVEMGDEMWDPGMMEEGAGGDWGLF